MRLIIDSDMAKMPRNCHECFLCYGGWCTVMPSEQDGMCPDSDRPEWCPLSIDAPVTVSQVIPVEWLSSKAAQAEHDIFYCKGDSRRNVEIMRSAIVVKELWEQDQRKEKSE